MWVRRQFSRCSCTSASSFPRLRTDLRSNARAYPKRVALECSFSVPGGLVLRYLKPSPGLGFGSGLASTEGGRLHRASANKRRLGLWRPESPPTQPTMKRRMASDPGTDPPGAGKPTCTNKLAAWIVPTDRHFPRLKLLKRIGGGGRRLKVRQAGTGLYHRSSSVFGRSLNATPRRTAID
jgi:hypothetical protein